MQKKDTFKLNIYFLQYKFYSRKNRELDIWKMKHVKKTCFQIRQESKQEVEALPKPRALSSFYWESSSSIQDSYVHMTLQTERARMENLRAESYFVQVIGTKPQKKQKTKPQPTKTNKLTKNPPQKHTKGKNNNHHSKNVYSTLKLGFGGYLSFHRLYGALLVIASLQKDIK